jgi:diguanylate cyclase (GGDEF)-like protein/PAS domain S-box-containing protein
MSHEPEVVRLQRRLERERRARLEAEAIAEDTTRGLYEANRGLRRSKSDLAGASALVALLQRAVVAANEAGALEEAARTVLDEVCHYTGWPVGHLYVTDGHDELAPSTVWHTEQPERYQRFREVTERTRLRAGVGLPGRVLALGRPVWITDVTKDNNFPRARQAVDIGVRAAFGFPVLVGTEVVAVLEFFAQASIEPDEHLLETMAHIGAQLGRVVERTRAQHALRASEEQIRLVIETAHDAFVAIDVDGRIVEWNRQAEQIFGWAREHVFGRPLAETIIPPQHREAHATGLARFLHTREGPVLGRRLELTALHRDGHEFAVEITPWSVGIGEAQRFNAFVHDISERKEFERQLAHQALHEPLTGLPNRALLLDRLRHGLARGRRDETVTAVLFIDLDRFKAVNDSLGHEAGDQLLLAVAARLPGSLRPGDTLARLGGDEFVILCEDLADSHDAVSIAQRLITGLATPFALPAGEVFVSASIGIAVAHGTGHDAEELLGDADMAMYRAKERGRGIYELYDHTMRARLIHRLATEKALRHGVDHDELFVVYQPTVDLATAAVTGVEALVRWQHPERGLLAPAEFIPLAEETGLIVPIGAQVLRQACRQVSSWAHSGAGSPLLCAMVNLSLHQLDDAFVNTVAEILHESGLQPERLILELTESALIHDDGSTMYHLGELRRLGVRLAIDDFGTGYSSLDRLRRMPVETLKIDKSFTAELETTLEGTPLVAAIITMAHSLGLRVIAEGVETPDQLSTLRRLGCDAAQGYLLSRPAPATDIEQFLRDPTPRIDPPAQQETHGAPHQEIEARIMRIISQAISGKQDVELTTRSLHTEIEHLIGLSKPA